MTAWSPNCKILHQLWTAALGNRYARKMKDIFLDDIVLIRDSNEPLVPQLSKAIRTHIMSGAIAPGDRLPSSRRLAERLKIARNVASECYATLISEGLLEARHGAGTFVVGSNLPQRQPGPTEYFHIKPTAPAQRLLQNAQSWRMPSNTVPFAPGVPAIAEFPWADWARSMTRAMRADPKRYLRENDAFGLFELRQAIAAHVGPARGIACSPDRIIILTSARQGFELVTRLFSESADTILVEDPGYIEARQIVLALGRKLRGCEVSSEGITLPQTALKRAKALFLTPTHHYPLGHRLSTDHAARIIEWSRTNEIVIVEDDYDGEFRHSGPPRPSLLSLDPDQQVIQIGTFSKSTFPGLRLAYAIVPAHIAPAMAAMRGLLDGQPSSVLQYGLAEFINSGAFAKHLRAMRKLYAARQNALLNAISSHGSGLLTPISSTSGLHLACHLPQGVNDQIVADRLNAEGIGVTPLSRYWVEPKSGTSGLVIGFGNTDAKTYPSLIARIAELSKVVPQESR